ncbi:Protein of unknown function [Bacillus sp. cl95]|nr:MULTISPECIES: DUF2663 family protein [unclassified Bacillus (in: firmicutes)]SFA98146.1 Protein of unknown function [Bacillus sp. UNCCL13]SFQ80848.1 Protein of unknown function [Bacillus sp. cl95]
MESPISTLDNRTDMATKKMLENLVKRKRKFDDFKFKHEMSIFGTITLSIIMFVYLYFTIIKNYSFSFASMFSAYANNSNHLWLLMGSVGMFGLMNLLKEKREKAEKEFHNLRCEIIDKSKDLWKKEEEWKNRHLVYEMMKDHYDINLYHENK